MAYNKGENRTNSVEAFVSPPTASQPVAFIPSWRLWMILATLGETVRDRLSALSPSQTKELIITFQTITALVDKYSFVQSFNRRSQRNVTDQVTHTTVFYFFSCPDHCRSETKIYPSVMNLYTSISFTNVRSKNVYFAMYITMYILPPSHNWTNTTLILGRVCQPSHGAIYPSFEYIQRLNFELFF